MIAKTEKILKREAHHKQFIPKKVRPRRVFDAAEAHDLLVANHWALRFLTQSKKLYAADNLIASLVSEMGQVHHLVVFTTLERLESMLTANDHALLQYLHEQIPKQNMLEKLKRQKNNGRWKRTVLQSFVSQGMTEAEQKAIVRTGTIHPRTMGQGGIRLVVALEDIRVKEFQTAVKRSGLSKYQNIAVYPVLPSSTFIDDVLK